MATKIWVGGTTGNTTTWATAGNWSPANAPATGDDVIVPANAAYAIAGADVSAALLLSFQIEKGCTVAIGSATTPLKIDADAIRLAGVGQQFLDLNNPTSDVIVTQAAGDSNYRSGLNITGAGIAKLSVTLDSDQTVGVATAGGETCTCSAFAISGSGSVEIGEGVSKVGGGAPDVSLVGGTVEAWCDLASVVTGGTFTHQVGDSTSITSLGGVLTINSAGTATLIVLAGGTLTMGPSAGTLTALQINGKGWTVNDPFGIITAAWEFVQCSPWDGVATVPANLQWTPAAIS